jgi:RimJ/RimL family protein N-acetyltransferase
MIDLSADQSSFLIRPAGLEDCEQYFRWACDSDVRANSLVTAALTFESHRRWFEERLSDPCSFLYVAERSGHPIGQVRLQNSDSSAVLSYSLDNNWRQKGLAKLMIHQSLSLYSADRRSCSVVVARVKRSNIASIRALESSGFCRAGPRKDSGVLLFKRDLGNVVDIAG